MGKELLIGNYNGIFYIFDIIDVSRNLVLLDYEVSIKKSECGNFELSVKRCHSIVFDIISAYAEKNGINSVCSQWCSIPKHV